MRADLWQRGCERLASELPDQQFNTWIRPLPDAEVADDGDGAVVTVRVPNRFKLDWIRNQYAGRIETVLSELAGKPVRLDVTLAQRDGMARPGEVLASTAGASGPAKSTRSVADLALQAVNGNPPVNGAPHSAAMSLGVLPSRSRLNPALTFETLV